MLLLNICKGRCQSRKKKLRSLLSHFFSYYGVHVALVLHGEVEGLVPLVEEDVEKDGSEDQPGLQEAVLGVLVVAAIVRIAVCVQRNQGSLRHF